MKNETKRAPKQGDSVLLRLILTVLLPVLALAVSVSFALLCARYGGVRRSLCIELGERSPEAGAFVRGERDDAAYAAAPEPVYHSAGNYRLRVAVNGRTVPVILRVRDTRPPTAEGIETTVPLGRSLKPDKLIRNLRDESVVRVAYETAPDFGTIGDYEAVILLEDASGNKARVVSTVHVRTVNDGIVLEAGDPAPTAEDFLVGSYETVSMTPITEQMLREPGVYPIRVTADGIEAETSLTVRDTVAPTGSGITCIAAPGDTVLPEMLVINVKDETAVETAFLTPPDVNSLEPQTVGVMLTDRGGNITTVYSTLVFSNVAPTVVEARDMALTVAELLPEGSYTEADFNMQFIPNKPGLHVLAVDIDGERNLALIDVQDTTPPAIRFRRKQWYLGTPTPADTLAEADDVTDVEIEYVAEPDWTKPEQKATIAATDASGNRSEKTFTLKLIPDAEPPTLYGVRDRSCYLNEPVAYLAEVFAWDDCDGDVAVTVDASAVDLTRLGDYPVTYSAQDKCGNTVTKSAVMRVVAAKVEENYAQSVAEKVLAGILTDDMTLAEQIEAIYDYVFTHVRYVATSDKQDWRSEAVRGLKLGRGDCFTAYAAARLLLEQTDAQILSVQRSGGDTHHYWMLVNIGTGWYHFDACNAWTGKQRCFMWTDAQTKLISGSYWRYDKTQYPAVATVPYNGGK